MKIFLALLIYTLVLDLCLKYLSMLLLKYLNFPYFQNLPLLLELGI